MQDQIKEYIKIAIQFEVEKEFEVMKEKMIKDLERRKNEICAGILIGVMERVDIATLGGVVTFSIREIKNK